MKQAITKSIEASKEPNFKEGTIWLKMITQLVDSKLDENINIATRACELAKGEWKV